MIERETQIQNMIYFFAAYKQFYPQFRKDYFTQDPIQTPQQNLLYFCNASIPGDANLEWWTETDLVPFLNSTTITSRSRSNLSLLTDVDDLCRASNHSGTFSIRFENFYMTKHDDADASTYMYLSQEIMLVLCSSRRSKTPTSYTCYSSSNHSVEGPSVPPLFSPSASYPITVVAVPIVVIVVLLLVVLMVVLTIVYLRYSRLKSEAPRMCPIESATASLIAGSLGLATLGLEPSDDSNGLEFPRENLQFVKVLG